MNNQTSVNKHALTFGLISVFLLSIGFTIISPVVPFLVKPYVENQQNQAIMVTLLTSVYAFFVFLASPILGALSDKLGRKPILLVCLFGSALGYFLFGLGGSLAMLFLGRIIEGITGGSISTIFAYFADITPAEQRTKYFGWVSATSGLGVIIGPTFGGFLANFGYAVPMFVGAAITLLNFFYGLIFMPEGFKKSTEAEKISISKLNPFSQLKHIFSLHGLAHFLIVGFFIWFAAGSLQAIFSQFSMDVFSFQPEAIGLIFSIMGVQDIVSQAFIMPKLLKKLSDQQITKLGIIAEFVGYGLLTISAFTSFVPFLVVGMFVYGFGDSIFGPSFNGYLSKSVNDSEQGRLLGGSQSIQSLARIFGPLIAGKIYVSIGHFAPTLIGTVFVLLALYFLRTNFKMGDSIV